jgi:hypothetical protein
MGRCDAGKGCVIECPGECVARWDELNFCETRCLGHTEQIKPLSLAGKFSLSLRCTGPQIIALFDQYLPKELSQDLQYYDRLIELNLRKATTTEFLEELNQLRGGLIER